MSFYRQYKGAEPAPYDELPELIASVNEKSTVDVACTSACSPSPRCGRYREVRGAGVRSHKFYMAYRGADGATVGMVNECDDGLLLEGLRLLGESGGVACVHAENTDIVNRTMRQVRESGATGPAGLVRRPAGVRRGGEHPAGGLLRRPGGRHRLPGAHRVEREPPGGQPGHGAAGGKVWVETCPHYLTHTYDSEVGSTREDQPAGAHGRGRRGDVARADRRLDVDTVGTDHCAVPLGASRADIWSAAAASPGWRRRCRCCSPRATTGAGCAAAHRAGAVRQRASIFGMPAKGIAAPGGRRRPRLSTSTSSASSPPGPSAARCDYSILDGRSCAGGRCAPC